MDLCRMPPYPTEQCRMIARSLYRNLHTREATTATSAVRQRLGLSYDPFTSRSKRGLPRSGANLGSILSQAGER